MSTLLPGTEVQARGLRWEIVFSQSLGSQTLYGLRGLHGAFNSRARASHSWSRSRRSNRRTGRPLPTQLALSEIGFCTIRRSCRNKRSVPVPFEELTASGGLQDLSEFRSKPFLRNGLQVVSRMT